MEITLSLPMLLFLMLMTGFAGFVDSAAGGGGQQLPQGGDAGGIHHGGDLLLGAAIADGQMNGGVVPGAALLADSISMLSTKISVT